MIFIVASQIKCLFTGNVTVKMRRAIFIFHPELVGQMSEVGNIRRCKHDFLARKNNQNVKFCMSV